MSFAQGTDKIMALKGAVWCTYEEYKTGNKSRGNTRDAKTEIIISSQRK